MSTPHVTADPGGKEDLSAVPPGEAVMGMTCWTLVGQVDVLGEAFTVGEGGRKGTDLFLK